MEDSTSKAYKAYIIAPLLGARHLVEGVMMSPKLFRESEVVRTKIYWTIFFNAVCVMLLVGVFHLYGPVALTALVQHLAQLADSVAGEYGLRLSVLRMTNDWLDELLLVYHLIFWLLWAIPLIVLTKVLSCFWYQDISDIACIYFKRDEPRRFKQTPRSASSQYTDAVYSALLSLVFMVQTAVVQQVPYAGPLLALVLNGLLVSLYSFEYTWFDRGVPLQKRVALISKYWTYFAGFGVPVSLLTTVIFSNWMYSLPLTAIVFPFLIITAAQAKVPQIHEVSEPVQVPIFYLAYRVTDAFIARVHRFLIFA
eukprot:scpid87942/ scgid34372/ Etoposide-induced protein 2.4 homolog